MHHVQLINHTNQGTTKTFPEPPLPLPPPTCYRTASGSTDCSEQRPAEQGTAKNSMRQSSVTRATPEPASLTNITRTGKADSRLTSPARSKSHVLPGLTCPPPYSHDLPPPPHCSPPTCYTTASGSTDCSEQRPAGQGPAKSTTVVLPSPASSVGAWLLPAAAGAWVRGCVFACVVLGRGWLKMNGRTPFFN